MNYEIIAPSSEGVYVAQLRGPSAKYRFERQFWPEVTEPLRSHKGSGPRLRYRFKLEPAIYEQSVNKEKSYFAVVGKRVVCLDQTLVKELGSFCSKHKVSWPCLVEQWMKSGNKTADGLTTVMADFKRKKEKARREDRAQRKPALAQRVEEASAVDIFHGSDGQLTRMYLARLEGLVEEGKIAAELFRAQKSSARAKQYPGRFKDYAYDRKSEVLEKLTAQLEAYGRFQWGWKSDPNQPYAPWVLYIDLPQGQVSFHALDRGDGPDYPGDWDRQHVSSERILQFCDSLARCAGEVCPVARA